ncbi:hypothetical protein Droror1_Dr00015696 [Drosera rotundifolia]
MPTPFIYTNYRVKKDIACDGQVQVELYLKIGEYKSGYAYIWPSPSPSPLHALGWNMWVRCFALLCLYGGASVMLSGLVILKICWLIPIFLLFRYSDSSDRARAFMLTGDAFLYLLEFVLICDA